MNATEQGLLHAIATEPDDDTHRLVYADWLDDHGQEERAEFIRAQVQLAADRTDSPARRALARRVRQLLDRHEAAWTGVPRGLALEWRFARGFVESALIRSENLKQLVNLGLFERLPLRSLGVLYLNRIDLLRHLPASNRLAALELVGNSMSAGTIHYLSQAPALARLRELDLSFSLPSELACEEITRQGWFRGLARLGLGGNPLPAAIIQLLEASLGGVLDFNCVRHPDHLYRLQNPRHRLHFQTGTLDGDYQVFVHETEEDTRFVLFDFEGNLLNITRRQSPEDRVSEHRVEATASWLEARGYVPGVIRVRRFETDPRHALVDYPGGSLGDGRQGDSGWVDVTDLVRRWLKSGRFVWRFGEYELRLDRGGGVVAS